LFNPDESKRAEKMLELAYPKSFQAWIRVRKQKLTLDLFYIVFMA
jgi:hypothetical protein